MGHYDNIQDQYIKNTFPKVKTLYSQSQDKIPKLSFKPKELHPEPTQDLDTLLSQIDYFKYSNASVNDNAHDFSKVVDREKFLWLRKQMIEQDKITREKK